MVSHSLISYNFRAWGEDLLQKAAIYNMQAWLSSAKFNFMVLIIKYLQEMFSLNLNY